MNQLYPLKVQPILKEKIWGGNKLHAILGKGTSQDTRCGESWEISGVQDNLSVVSNGFLKGNNLEEIIEVYMGELVGDQVYEKYGFEFPLLIKFIDANDVLSIQVHPDDMLAKERHTEKPRCGILSRLIRVQKSLLDSTEKSTNRFTRRTSTIKHYRTS